MMLAQIRRAIPHFLNMRHRFSPMVYGIFTSEQPERFLNSSDDERAEIVAANLVGASLTGAPSHLNLN